MTELLCRMFLKDADHTEDPSVRTQYGTMAAITGIVVNILLAAMKFIVGIVAGSVAITADAVNNLSDAAGSIVTLITVRLSNKPVDPDHPFGHGRMEYLGSFIVSLLIILMGITLFKDGITSILHPEAPAFSLVVIILLGVSILMKLWLFFFYRKIGNKVKNGTLLAASKDSLGDVLATSAVLISVALNLLFGWSIDGWIGLLVSIVVLKAGIDVCRDTVDSLLGGRPDPEKIASIKEILLSHEGILGVHDLILHDYGPGRCFASAHAEVSADADILITHELIDDIEKEIWESMKIPICIHMDPIVTTDEECNRLKEAFIGFLAQKELQLHDFRRVPGEHHVNLIFDVAVPSGYPQKKQLMSELEAFAAKQGEQYRLVVHFDDLIE